ncbi:MAG: type I restriction enzyme HsdR N-terminal domain-containing protein [Gammaproteobacteria bacterium]
MSVEESITVLTKRLPGLLGHLQTEESTKNALVMPFLAALGYDVFNPQEVVPEFTADVGIKKGEKVDYAIVSEGETIMLIECKKAGVDLKTAEMSQLYRYFSVTHSRIAVLTNGIKYWLYSDLEQPNKMDDRPFFEFDLSDLRPSALREIKKLSKENFNLDQVLSTASELKYTSQIKKELAAQIDKPDEEIVRFFYNKIQPGARFIPAAKEQFTPLVERALKEFINERVSDRLRTALKTDSVEDDTDEIPDSEHQERENGIITTEEELDGFRIIRAIVCKFVTPERVVHRDTKSYMGILLDDNNRKPICRLWFNTKQKYIGLFDANKNETRVPIEHLEDIYQYSEELIKIVLLYDGE